MPAHFQATHTKDRNRGQRRDVEQRAAAVGRKQRLQEVREQEAGVRRQRRDPGFMAAIGYGYDE